MVITFREDFKGKVIKGVKKGREIGFPTINISIENIPKDLDYGVYTCKIHINKNIYKGVMHYGSKSIGTLDPGKIHCEIHILKLDYEGNITKVSVQVLKKIRSVRKFESEKALKEQITKDINIANKYF